MKRKSAVAGTLFLLLGLAATALAIGAASRTSAPIYDGPQLDYQPAIIRREPGGEIVIVLERISLPSFHGDLYGSHHVPGSSAWPTPYPLIDSTLNERHPSLVQVDAASFLLFYLVDETGSGSYRLHRATSTDGFYWADQGAIDLGWTTPGEINPNVIREADGTLTMTYHRLSGPSYIAQSQDDGETWDKVKTQVSPGNAQLPRLAKRQSDGLYLITYQVGGSNLDLYAKVSADPYDWLSLPQIPLSTDYDTHDSQPIVLEDGTFLVTYAKRPVYYYDLFYRTSCDGVRWMEEVQVTDAPSLYDTQPHPLPQGTPGHVVLTWPHQDPSSSQPYQDHDLWIDLDLLIPPDLNTSSKAVEPATFRPGGPLTFTLLLANEGHGPAVASLIDPLPAGATYQPGSLWASSGQASHNPLECTINWSGLISTCAQVTITFRVSTSSSLADGDLLTNTAWLTDGQCTDHTLVTTAIADLPPELSAFRPASGAIDVPITATIVLTFSEPIVTGTLAYSLTPDPGGWSAAWNGDATAATLSHAGLTREQTYTFTLTQARDLALNPLAPVEWTFTTQTAEIQRRIYLPLVLKITQSE